jgi:hypothetical protein
MERPVLHAEINRAAVNLCRLALARGPLIRDGNQWRFGRRCFSNATVRRLIDEGSAVRFGNVVRQTVIGRPTATLRPT